MKLDPRPRRPLTSREWASILGALFGCALTLDRIRGGDPEAMRRLIASLATTQWQPYSAIRVDLPTLTESAAASYVTGTVFALIASCSNTVPIIEALKWWSEHLDQLGRDFVDARLS